MSADKLKTLKQQRGCLKANVTRLIKFFDDNIEADIHDCESRQIKLEEYNTNFEKIQLEIELASGTVDESSQEEQFEVQEDERAEFEKKYYTCLKIIKMRLQAIRAASPLAQPDAQFIEPFVSVARSDASTPQNITYHINHGLEKLQVRPYDGNPREWQSFRDAFTNLVHKNDAMPATEKFYRLKQSLQGDLINLLDGLDASEENYKVAWDLISQRCDKPRKIIQSHLKQILELPAMKTSSAVLIRSLKEKAQMHVNALKALKEPVDSWDSVLVYIISRKLDRFTRKSWEETLEDSAKPKFTDLIAFLKKKERDDGDYESPLVQSNNTYNTNNANTNKKSKTNTQQSLLSTNKSDLCTFCKQDHRVYSCPQLLNINQNDRADAVREKRLCLNCLRDNHSTKQCRASGCRTCSKKHNSLLHFINNPNANQNNSMAENQNVEEKKKVTLTVTQDSEVLLATARINILDKYNKPHSCRALLDTGSQTNFISEELASKLKLD